MIAAKQFDMVLGVDIHIIQPPGPVPPVPIPHPFIGMVWDPIEFIPFIGTSVWVNGMPGVVAGSEGVAMPPHFPIGGTFIKPIDNECEVFMGSATVNLEGEPMSFLGMPVLSCSCIGMPAPPRAKKSNDAGLKLPTSVLLAIPAGKLVLVGGPPTVSLMAVGMKVLGMGFNFLKKTKKWEKISDKIHDAASKVSKKLPDNLRNKVHKGICAVTGHPVEIATGKVFTDHVDFEFPGPIPMRWERTWYSVSGYQGPLGHGWHHSYDLYLQHDNDGESLIIRMADGRNIMFPLLFPGESAYNRQEKLQLTREEEYYVLRDKANLYYQFKAPPLASTKRQALIRISNAMGHAIQFQYTQEGHLKKIIDSAGRVFPIRCDYKGRIVKIDAPHPEKPGEYFTLVSYTYSGEGDLIKMQDALKKAFMFVYDHHLLIRETNRNGLSFHFSYDARNRNARCLRTWGDGGIYDHKLTYFEEEQLTVVENSLGQQTKYYWNDDGQVYKTVDPLGNERITKYGTFGQSLAEIDELGQATYFDYDEFGNQTAIFYPDGSTLQMEYQENLLVKATNQIGCKWEWVYNDKQQLVERRDPLGQIMTYQYADVGLLHKLVDTTGEETTIEYDQNHNLCAIITPDGAKSEWKYDALGRVLRSIDPKGNEQRRKYNFLNQILRVNEPDGNIRQLEYDQEGNVIRVKDKQHDVRFEYQGMGRMRARIEAGTRVEFQYDTEENLTTITNEHGSVYRFERNENGEVTTEAGFDGITRQYQRNAEGRVTTVLRPGGKQTFYHYDPLGRVTLVKHNDGTEEAFVYRADGEMMEAKNEAIKIQFERDALGRVVKEIQGSFEIESVYDPLGMRIELHSSLGAHLRFGRSNMGDVKKVEVEGVGQKWEAQFQRDKLGLELERSLPGGVRSQWKRDRLGRPIKQETFTGGGKQVQSRQYVWDVNDRLKQLIDEHKGTCTFEHDIFGNLASAQYPDGSMEWRTPDAVGNLFRTQHQKDRKYGSAGQLLEANGTRYAYDLEGNLIQKTEANGKVWLYEWNAAGMLRQVVRPDGKAVIFTYDALGRRIAKQYRNKVTYWVWDGNNILHEWVEHTKSEPPKIKKISNSEDSVIKIRKRDTLLASEPGHAPPITSVINALSEAAFTLAPAQDKLTTWVFEPESFSPLAKLSAREHYSIVSDHLGTPVGMYDDKGQQVWQMDLSIYGEVREMKGWRETCPFRYPGQYEDEETGLYYNRFRYYDVEIGAYLSPDPIGIDGGLRVYSYVHDVNTWVDLLGLSQSPYDGNFEKINDSYLKRKGHDAHQIKREMLGRRAKISRYDLYKNKDTREIWIFEKGGRGEGIPTGEILD